MSIEATSWAWSLPLKPSTKLVLLRLADRANGGNTCWPSISSVANDTGLSYRTVSSSLTEIEKLGLTEVSKALGAKSRYTLNVGKGIENGSEADGPRQNLPTPLGNGCLPPRQWLPTPRQNLPTPPAESAYLPRQNLPTNLPVESSNESPTFFHLIPQAEISCERREEQQKKNGGVLSNSQGPEAEGSTESAKGKAPVNGHSPHDPASGFAEFWDNYPRGHRTNKAAALRAWVRLGVAEFAELVAADVKWRHSHDVRWQDGWIPAPEKYLDGRKWEDDILTARPVISNTRRSEAGDDIQF